MGVGTPEKLTPKPRVAEGIVPPNLQQTEPKQDEVTAHLQDTVHMMRQVDGGGQTWMGCCRILAGEPQSYQQKIRKLGGGFNFFYFHFD